jgi:hypothetical protein
MSTPSSKVRNDMFFRSDLEYVLERSLVSLILWPPPLRVLLVPSHHLSRTIIFPSYSSPAKVATGEILALCNMNQLQTDSGGVMFCHCQMDSSSILNHLVHDVPAADLHVPCRLPVEVGCHPIHLAPRHELTIVIVPDNCHQFLLTVPIAMCLSAPA